MERESQAEVRALPREKQVYTATQGLMGTTSYGKLN